MDEMYDLRSDPYEMNNVIDETDSQARLAKLKAVLSTLTTAN
jgi:hypothetical protein